MPTRTRTPRPRSRVPAERSAFIHDQLREAARQPTETPRKHAISTMLVKNVKNMTVLPNQRMHASSRNRIMKLIKKSSMLAHKCPARDGDALGCSGAGAADTTGTVPPDQGLRLGQRTIASTCKSANDPPQVEASSINERHRRDQRRLDFANDPGGVFDLFGSHVEMRTCPDHLRPGHADQDAARAPDRRPPRPRYPRTGSRQPIPGWSRRGLSPARSPRYRQTPPPEPGHGHDPR